MLTGKRALVTGASRGLGAAIARRLAAHGAAVALLYHVSRDRCQALAAELRTGGAHAVALGADLRKPEAPATVFAQAERALGGIDVVVNNAYPGWTGGAFETLPWSAFQDYVDAMVRPAVELARAALPGMRARRWGRLVFLGSTSMYELNGRHTAYLAGKGALLALVRGLARETGVDGVTVNMVSPSLVWTGDDPEPADWGAAHRERSAMGRLPSAEEVAGAVVFFASDLASGVTGAQLPVSCGSPMHVG